MFRNLPPITKNLLLINLICYLADVVFQRYGISFSHVFGLHYLTASDFRLWQPLTYMFMHANFSHFFFNMFAVLMFAPAIEERWGSKRFLIYYLVTGIGAGVIQEIVWALQLQPILSSVDPMMAAALANRVVTIGASGAVFGILLAFGWLFPDVRMYIMFIPIPIRARTLSYYICVDRVVYWFGSFCGRQCGAFRALGRYGFRLVADIVVASSRV